MRSAHHRVEDYMSTALVTAAPDDAIDDVDFEMKMANVRHIPVLDRQRLVGIVSQRDLLRALARSDGRSVVIRSIMTTRVRTVPADAPALQAIDLMLTHKIGCVPALGEDGQLVGLVTETDFLRLARQVLVGVDGDRAGRRRTG